jgi:hypothetical protein
MTDKPTEQAVVEWLGKKVFACETLGDSTQRDEAQAALDLIQSQAAEIARLKAVPVKVWEVMSGEISLGLFSNEAAANKEFEKRPVFRFVQRREIEV